MNDIMVRPDAKGRIALGELSKGVSSYKITKSENGQLILNPYTEIPYAEKWLFENPELIEKFKQHLEKNQSA
jgi:hypothetical protein